MFVYDSYEVGKVYGCDEFHVTRDVVSGWRGVFGTREDTDSMPSGMVILMQQQAYKRVITPRPPGHVQGRQRFDIQALPTIGSVVSTEVSCISKEIRKGRRWVDMGFHGTSNGTVVYTGINTVLVPC